MWRVGRKLGRTLYKDDTCVGMVDTPDLAADIVGAMNGPDDEDARKRWGMQWSEVHRERRERDRYIAERDAALVESARLRAALEEITRSHPALVTRGGGPSSWLIAKAALLGILVKAGYEGQRQTMDEVIAEWAKTEPAVRR